MNPRSLHTALLSATLVLFLACLAPATVAHGATASANVASSKAALDKALAEHQEARLAVDESRRQVDAASARLNRLIANQNRVQQRLNAQAVATYRTGEVSFVTLLTGAATYDSFVNRWLFLLRFNRQSAATLGEIKTARRRSAQSARDLLPVQTRASARLRALDSTVARARKDLSTSSTALAEYQRRTAEAASRAADTSASRSVAPPTPAPSRSVAPAPSQRPTVERVRATDSQGWRSARVSNYGPGSYGRRTANGTVVTADSMIVAHKTMRFGTLIEFSYGGRRAVAVVADRGPYIAGRQFDLGPGTARTLGLNGVYTVQYRVVGR